MREKTRLSLFLPALLSKDLQPNLLQVALCCLQVTGNPSEVRCFSKQQQTSNTKPFHLNVGFSFFAA